VLIFGQGLLVPQMLSFKLEFLLSQLFFLIVELKFASDFVLASNWIPSDTVFFYPFVTYQQETF